MIRAEDTALVLLAAGRSRRFGAADKLMADFLGRPLGLHVAVALDAVPFAHRYVVTGADGGGPDYSGYTRLVNDGDGDGMARSVAIGVAAAQADGAGAVLVALADMPRVTATHVWRLFDASGGDDTVVASSDGTRPMPPALFGRARFGFLRSLQGDAGARALVAGGRHVVASAAELVDIDTPEQLATLHAQLAAPRHR